MSLHQMIFEFFRKRSLLKELDEVSPPRPLFFHTCRLSLSL